MLDFIGDSGIFVRAFTFLFLLFQVQFLSAQVEISTPSAVISVSGGSKIYSADESFNQQLKQGSFTVKNAYVSNQNTSKGKHLLIVHKKSSKSNLTDLASQLKEAEAKKKSEILKKIQKRIAYNKAIKDKAKVDCIQSHPYSGSFSHNLKAGKHYVNERNHQHDQNETSADEKHHSVIRALDYLHSQKFYAYNSRSIEYCYDKVFSVRPPPFFV